jgi:hypothetical protein
VETDSWNSLFKQGEKMKSMVFILIAMLAVPLLASSESEAEKKLNAACSKDMSEYDNEESCRNALFINCGGFVGVGVIKGCVEYDDLEKCVGVPAYCIKAYSKLFDFPENGQKDEKTISEYITEIGTYIKLQEMYIGEFGNDKLGTWSQLGFKAFSGASKEIKQGDVRGIQISNQKNFEDCPANSNWIVRCRYYNNEPVCDFSIQSTNGEACEKKSPGFRKMGESLRSPFIKTTYESYNGKMDAKGKKTELQTKNVEYSASVLEKSEGNDSFLERKMIKDARDGKSYKTVIFNGKTWLSENLNYSTKGSVCYDNVLENCEKYGRLYNWLEAKNACPKGWHLPSEKEWDKAPSGIWDIYAGYFYVVKGSFYKKDATAYYWVSSEIDSEKAVDMDLNVGSETFVKKTHSKNDVMFSVRCVKN